MSLDLKSLQKKLENAVEAGLKKVGVMSAGSSYFTGARKGESAELQADLNSNNRLKQVNALKRIIANMSLGRDVSQLFPDVVKLGQSTNLETKKLVYLYVLSNARLQPEKALLAVNTFLLDCHTNASPIIRALAIRTMLCLRVDSVLEYLVEPLKKALTVDGDPYVRKTAAIGVLKLFHQSPRTMEEHGFLPILVNMVGDTNPTVAANAAAALHEIVTYRSPAAAAAAPLQMPPRWADKLLHTLPECSEWGQGYVLELLASGLHTPSEDQLSMTIDRILPRLSHLNPTVVMSAVKCVLVYMRLVKDAELRANYLGRVNNALMTLSRTQDADMQFVVIKNIQALLPLYPTLLRDRVDGFLVRFNDPLCVKREKLRLLMMLVHESNVDKVVKELAEYAADVDLAFLARVVHAIAVTSIKQPQVVDRCIALLHRIAEKQKDMLPSIFVAAKNVLRRHPDKALALVQPLLSSSPASPTADSGAGAAAASSSSSPTTPSSPSFSSQLIVSIVEADLDATVALVWILGEFCDVLPNGMESLDYFTGSFATQEPAVQNAVMTALVKLFLRNPKQVERLLTPLFETATKASLDPDVRDRAFMYWRLLSKGNIGVERMKAIVHSATRAAAIDVTERRTAQRLSAEDVVASLNSAATVLERPAKSFLLPYGLRSLPAGAEDADEEDDGVVVHGEIVTAPADGAGAKPQQQQQQTGPKGGKSIDELFTQPAPSAQQQQQQQRPVVAAPPAPPSGNKGGLDDIFSTNAAAAASSATARPVTIDPFAQVAALKPAAAPTAAKDFDPFGASPPKPVAAAAPGNFADDLLFGSSNVGSIQQPQQAKKPMTADDLFG